MGEILIVRFEDTNHGVSPLQGREYSLCGVAWDTASVEDMPELEWEIVHDDNTPIDCPDCKAVIEVCRKLKT